MTYFCFLKCRKRDLLLFVGLKAEVIEQDIIQRLGLTLINLIRVNEGRPTQTDIFLKSSQCSALSPEINFPSLSVLLHQQSQTQTGAAFFSCNVTEVDFTDIST